MEVVLSADGTVTERLLMERAKTGDREAFGELVSRHMRRAYFAALGLVGSHDDALDMSQEAFARAFRARKTLDPERPFYPWLYQIIRRLCFNVHRDRRTRRARLVEATPWLVEQAGRRAAADDPARRAENAELRERLDRAIDQLPAHERETLVLREFEGLRYREIAELLGIPIGTVMSRLYSARKALAKTLRGELSE
ncbi:MAG: sigma-70 family RNA polymerase sigma factor [Gemmatimonadales bacterium]